MPDGRTPGGVFPSHIPLRGVDMKIGVIGSGGVGQTIANGLLALQHHVKIGTRDPAKLAEWVKTRGIRASVGSFEDAADFGEIVVLATLWSGTKAALDLAKPAKLKDKIVIDVTNPFVFSHEAAPTLAVGLTDSGGEQVQRWLPQSRVVKTLNTVGNAYMFQPEFPHGPPTMFYCGNDDEAKYQVARILNDFGWESVNVGNIEAARLLEPMALLWVTLGIQTGKWSYAFKLLHKF